MRFSALLLLTAMSLGAATANAQDTLNDPVRAGRIRQLIEQRFGERLREELGLTNDQSGRMRVALAGLAARRRVLEQEERRMHQALAAQLRPGIAADVDSVARLVDAMVNHRVAFAQSFNDEMRELASILSPVQRGQYLLARERLMQRAQEAMQEGRRPQALLPPRRRP